MPSDLVLAGSWSFEWDAVDPVTGATVPGVKVSQASVVGADMSPPPRGKDDALGPFMLVKGPEA